MLVLLQPMVLAAAEQLEQVAHAIASQPLWCLGEELPEFKVLPSTCMSAEMCLVLYSTWDTMHDSGHHTFLHHASHLPIHNKACTCRV
jgi:hypothetical protein